MVQLRTLLVNNYWCVSSNLNPWIKWWIGWVMTHDSSSNRVLRKMDAASCMRNIDEHGSSSNRVLRNMDAARTDSSVILNPRALASKNTMWEWRHWRDYYVGVPGNFNMYSSRWRVSELIGMWISIETWIKTAGVMLAPIRPPSVRRRYLTTWIKLHHIIPNGRDSAAGSCKHEPRDVDMNVLFATLRINRVLIKPPAWIQRWKFSFAFCLEKVFIPSLLLSNSDWLELRNISKRTISIWPPNIRV